MRSPQRSNRARESADQPPATPYDEWPVAADAWLADVGEAVGAEPLPMWRKAATDRARRLTVADLAVGLYCVSRTAAKGTNYGQLAAAFRVAGVGFHRAKGAAVLATLVRLGLVEQTGNYSAGGRGNVYRVVTDAGERARLRADPTLRRKPPRVGGPTTPQAEPPTVAPEDDDPFA